jgi:hypothetical protein
MNVIAITVPDEVSLALSSIMNFEVDLKGGAVYSYINWYQGGQEYSEVVFKFSRTY